MIKHVDKLLYAVSVRMQGSLRVNNIRTSSAVNVTCPPHIFSPGGGGLVAAMTGGRFCV